ncbi:MAG: DNA translocase FtsK 4TM domain-containing protein [Maricaulaceae bacterium]
MPHATANFEDYDAAYAQSLMDDVKAKGLNPGQRALAATLIGLLGFFILFSVLSFSPFDTTGDTAGLGKVTNKMGRPGARAANILLQFIGMGSVILGGLIFISGLKRIFKAPQIRTGWETTGRIIIILGAVLFGAATFSAFPIPQSWPMATGLGGWLGDGLYLNFKAALDYFNLPISGLLVAIMSFAACAYCLARYFGVVGKDFLDLWDAAGLVWATFRVWFDRLATYLRARFEKTYAADVASDDTISTLMRDVPDVPQPEAPASPYQVITPSAVVTPAAETPKAKPKPRRKKKPKAPEFNFPEGSGFVLPGLDLLKVPPPRKALTDEASLMRSSENLHRVMSEYGIKGEMGAVRPGPVVTLFEFEPAPGMKSQRIINLSDDIARNMSAQSARIAVVPGRNAMGVELPNRRRETVWLRDMLASQAFADTDANLPMVLGEDIGGTPYITDLSKMPHLLVAGTTGSGKSVGVNAMILSLMYKLTPEECKFIMIDPKMLELSVYDGAPHLLAPVVTEPKKAVVALKWTVREMEDRYRKMSKMGVRSMAGYNEKVNEAKANGEVMTRTQMTGYDKESGEPIFETEELNFEPLPYIVVIIDEMADLMMVAGKDIEGAVQRLAQMARAAGIHMIMATQRPSVDVITGTIKANFPTRISFRVGSKIDSRTILGEQGGEQLLGNGDMLYMGTGRPRRLHGPFVSDGEVERVAAFIKAQGSPSYLHEITEEPEETEALDGNGGGENSLFDQAVAIVARDRKASTSYIQRRLSIGYNRAADLIDRMEQEGMISAAGSGGKREIFLPD